MKIATEVFCKFCRVEKAVAEQIQLGHGFVAELYFCKHCNETNPNYKPKIMEVYKIIQ